jgi:hypothetical protein
MYFIYLIETNSIILIKLCTKKKDGTSRATEIPTARREGKSESRCFNVVQSRCWYVPFQAPFFFSFSFSSSFFSSLFLLLFALSSSFLSIFFLRSMFFSSLYLLLFSLPSSLLSIFFSSLSSSLLSIFYSSLYTLSSIPSSFSRFLYLLFATVKSAKNCEFRNEQKTNFQRERISKNCEFRNERKANCLREKISSFVKIKPIY